MATFVLVHGAWHGAWCWRRVTDLLTARGHKVYAPTLSGLADRSHLLSRDVTLDTHIADVVNLIAWEELDDIVLVGHSYAGWVISGVAEQVLPRIASIVFLDAFFPENGQRGVDLQGVDPATVTAMLDKGQFGRAPPPIEQFGVEDKDRAWVLSKLTPQPAAISLTPIRLTGAREKVPKKTYIRARGADRPQYDAYFAKLKGDKTWALYEVPCGHDVMISMPERLVEILLERA